MADCGFCDWRLMIEIVDCRLAGALKIGKWKIDNLKINNRQSEKSAVINPQSAIDFPS